MYCGVCVCVCARSLACARTRGVWRCVSRSHVRVPGVYGGVSVARMCAYQGAQGARDDDEIAAAVADPLRRHVCRLPTASRRYPAFALPGAVGKRLPRSSRDTALGLPGGAARGNKAAESLLS